MKKDNRSSVARNAEPSSVARNADVRNADKPRQVTLSQDWNIKPGVTIPAHTTLGVAPVYYEQLQAAGMVAEPESKAAMPRGSSKVNP